MAYIVKYGEDFLFDPYGDDDERIFDASLSAEVNASAYFDFTISSNHRLYDKIKECDKTVKLYSDKKLLFVGEITDIQEDFYGSKSVSCVDPRDHLNDIMLRPYSTIEGEQDILAPSSIEGYFQWLIDQYNKGGVNLKFKFDVGVNQGAALSKTNYIYCSSTSYPTVASELENNILDKFGGYLILTYPNEQPILNLYADVHEANTQIIDFGVNLLDFTKTVSTDKLYTAVRPEGGTPESDGSGETPKPITIESISDGTTEIDSNYVKMGDVVYNIQAVNRYGYKEYSYTNTDLLDPKELLEDSIKDLKKIVEPRPTIEVKAVDLALFMDGYDHLDCGEVARVRSKPHKIDEYLVVSSIDIDLMDPSQTTYTLGQAYNSLTGEQSSFVKSLNAGINSNYDAVSSLDQTIKDQAVMIGEAQKTAEEASGKAENAQTVAESANQTANSAQESAQGAQTVANSALGAANEAKESADSANETAEDAKTSADNAQKTANDAKASIDETNQAVQQIQENVSAISEKADQASSKADAASIAAESASEKASQAASKADSLSGKVTEFDTKITDFETQVSGAVSTANEALEQSSSTSQDLNGFKQTVSSTYATKDALSQEILDRNSAIEQSANKISATVSSNYTELTGKIDSAQSDADDALAAAKTASDDLASFSSTVTGDLKDLQSQIDGSIQTWFYNGVPTISNPPASDWTTDEIKNNHLGDLYYDLDTGYSYRFMNQNGIYSWSRLTDSDVELALRNAAKAQDTADNKRRVFVSTPVPPYDVGDLWVQGSSGDIKRCQTAKTSSQSYAAADWVLASKYTDDSALNAYKNVVSTTYATKSDLSVTENNIRAEVSDTYQVKGDYATNGDLDGAIAQEVLDRNAAIDVKANAITTTVSQTYATKTSVGAVEEKADAAQSAANAAQSDLDSYKGTVSETYATKTSVTQTADSILATVSETYTTKTESDEISAAADTAQQTANNASDRLTEVKSSLELLSDSISTMVTDENGSSLMTQTSTGWTFNIGSIQSSIEQNANQINSVSGNVSEIGNLAQQTSDLVNDISEKTSYITMAEDENGDPCVELGRQDSPFKVRITNTSIDFMEDDIRIAYITNRQLYIQSSVVTDEMKVGATSGFVWKKRGNGNMGLRWEAS